MSIQYILLNDVSNYDFPIRLNFILCHYFSLCIFLSQPGFFKFSEKSGNANKTRIGQQVDRNYIFPKTAQADPDSIFGEGVSGTGEGELLCPYGQYNKGYASLSVNRVKKIEHCRK
jgi:hypothetical protein